MQFSIRSGVFLISFSLLFLEIIATRVFASILGDEFLLYTVPLAMLGLGAAGSISILTPPVRDQKRLCRRAMYICCFAGTTTFLLFVCTAVASSFHNAQLDSLVNELGSFEYYSAVFKLSLILMAVVGFVMALSYFFNGFVLNQIFRNVEKTQIHILYAADLVGAFAGAVAAVVSLEFGGFWVPLGIAINAPILAAAAFTSAQNKRRALSLVGIAVALMGLLSIPGVSSNFESTPHLRSMARLFGPRQSDYRSVKEFGHWWTSYGLISAVEVVDPQGNSQAIMVHGAGEGHARVIPFQYSKPPAETSILYGAELSVAGCQPNRVLVLLVGPGTEMVLIDRITQGKAQITGVELISKVVEWPLNQERFRLKEFFSNPNHKLVIAEAREFLARDKTRYDCILVSWSGASRSYYTGLLAHLPNHIYTREGIEELLSHLSPNGQLTILDANKVRLMLTAQDILRSKGSPSVPESFVVLGEPNQWGVEPNQRLLIKPSGFTRVDVTKIAEVAKRAQWDFLYEPFMSPFDSNFWYEAMHSAAPAEFVEPLARDHGMDVDPSTDDKPFVFDVLPPNAIFNSWFWVIRNKRETSVGKNMSESVVASWIAKQRSLFFALIFCVVSGVLILGPLLLKRSSHEWPMGLRRNMAYFASLGAGFMFIEMGMIQKFRLLVGHPGYTLAVVLASIVLFLGLGSLASGRLFGMGILTLRRAALLSILTTIACIMLFDTLSPILLAFPREQKMILAFFLPAIPAFFMGQLFPQGLAIMAKFEGEIPLQMAVNALTGTIASIIGVTLAQLVGFNRMIFIGTAFYLIAGLLSGGSDVSKREAVPHASS